MTYEEQQEIVRTHVCLDCGACLVLAHDPATGDPQVRCGQDKSHHEYRLPAGPEKKVRRGEYPPGATERDKVTLEAAVAHRGQALTPYLSRDLESGETAPPELVAAIMELAQKTRLRVELGHLCIYRGRPRVTADGYYYHAARQGAPVRVGARPMTAEERTAYQVADGDYAWLARGYISGVDQQVTGLGIVTAQEIAAPSRRDPSRPASPVVARHPQRMAEKRAEWQLLRKLVPLGIEESPDADNQAH